MASHGDKIRGLLNELAHWMELTECPPVDWVVCGGAALDLQGMLSLGDSGMTTWPTTFEPKLREALLDLLHEQWLALGIPFSVPQPRHPNEVIDPEALLWCSLEFLPTQPRLREQVVDWLGIHDQYLIRPRIRRFAADSRDPRVSIWRALDPSWEGSSVAPEDSCLGLNSRDEILAFCQALAGEIRRGRGEQPAPSSPWDSYMVSRTGIPAKGPGTVLLWARDVVGLDARHFLLVYLLACPGGAKLRAICQWSGQSYRTAARVAQRWEAAGVVRVEHGFCRLRDPGPWRQLLGIDSAELVLVDWFRAYGACVGLLRALEKAERKGLPADSPVIGGLAREAAGVLTDCLLSGARAEGSSADRLRELLPARG